MPTKKIAGVVIAATVLGGVYFGAQKTPEQKIEDEQAAYLSSSGKYQRAAAKDGYSVNEYVTPEGKPGYEIIKETETHIMIKAYGPEADERTMTTAKPPPPLPSTTATST